MNLVKQPCPACSRPTSDELRLAHSGDFHICDGCGAIARVTEELGLELVPSGDEDLRRFPWLLRTQHLIRADRSNASLA